MDDPRTPADGPVPEPDTPTLEPVPDDAAVQMEQDVTDSAGQPAEPDEVLDADEPPHFEP